MSQHATFCPTNTFIPGRFRNRYKSSRNLCLVPLQEWMYCHYFQNFSPGLLHFILVFGSISACQLTRGGSSSPQEDVWPVVGDGFFFLYSAYRTRTLFCPKSPLFVCVNNPSIFSKNPTGTKYRLAKSSEQVKMSLTVLQSNSAYRAQ